jgi:hypothetical protein
MEQLIIWLLFVLVVLAFCWFKPNAARIFLGFFFIVMGIGFHLALILLNPHGYDGFSTSALLPLYRWAFREIVMLYPLAFALVATAFEIAVALLMLGKRQYAKTGLIVGGLFLFAITPLGVETLPNALLALGLVYLATKEFPISFWELVRAKLHHQLPRAVG